MVMLSPMKPKALDCCRNYSFGDVRGGIIGRRKLRCSQQSRAFGFIGETCFTNPQRQHHGGQDDFAKHDFARRCLLWIIFRVAFIRSRA